MKKLKVVKKAPTFFVVMGICIQKTMNTEIKLTCGVFSTKKHCYGTAYIEFGKFVISQKHNHPKSFAETEKTKVEARIMNESERSTLPPRDIYKKYQHRK